MAYVGISATLKSRVESLIHDMQRKELHMIHKERMQFAISPETQWVKEYFWENHIGLYETIPPEWCGTQECIDLRVSVPGKPHVMPDLYFTSAAKVPPNRSNNRLAISSEDKIPAEARPLVEQAWAEAEVGIRWKAVEKQVITFLEQCPSLNQAVKLWPDIKMYIPQDFLDKLAEQSNKSRAKRDYTDALSGLDVDALTSAAVLARIATGNNNVDPN